MVENRRGDAAAAVRAFTAPLIAATKAPLPLP
jgi:hypothetical protein